MRVAKNLTLNLGLRYEFTTNPRDASLQTLNSVATLPGVFEFRKPKTDKNNFGPRVGFAYSPDFSGGLLGKIFGEPGKSSIRGGFGMAYDVNFQNLVLLQLPPQLQTEQNPNITCASATPPAWCETGRGFLAGGGLLQDKCPPDYSGRCSRFNRFFNRGSGGSENLYLDTEHTAGVCPKLCSGIALHGHTRAESARAGAPKHNYRV